jgi:hypothetical protein
MNEDNEVSKYNDSDNESINFLDAEGNHITTTTSKVLKQELTEEAEDMGTNRSALIRRYIIAGRRLSQIYDPREAENVTDTESKDDPIRNLVPKGKNNAISIEELGEKVKNDIIDIVENDDQINRDGWEVYK